MKLSTYTPQVNRNTINARVQAPGSLQAYGADQSGAIGTSRLLGGLADMSQRIMIDDDKRTLLEAMDAYNKGRYDILYGDNGLMKTNLEGAAGISQSYTEQERKLRENVLKNVSFKTRNYELAFGDMANKSAQQGFELVNKHQYTQGEEVKNVRLNNNLTEYLNFAQQNYNDPGIVAGTAQMAGLLIAARYEGYGDEFIKSKTREALGGMGGALINTAIAGNNYERAASLLNEFDEALTAEQRTRFTKAIEDKRKTQVENSFAQSIYDRFGDDMGAAYDYIQNADAGNMMNFDQLFDSMTQQESGGNTNAVNARTGAYGSLQIMPENWASWSREALGYVGDMKDPETYTKVARHKLQQYYNAYGAEGAMVAWYAGPENGRRWAAGEATAIGANGREYSWDARQGNGDEPSIREYVQQVSGRVGLGFEDKEALFNEYKQIAATQKQIKESRENRGYLEAFKMFTDMRDNGQSYAAAMAQAEQMGGSNPEAISKLRKAVKIAYGGSSDYNGLGSERIDAAEALLGSGEFRTVDDYLSYLEMSGASQKQLADGAKMFNEFMNSEGQFKFDWGDIKENVVGSIKDKKAKELSWAGAQQYGKWWISDYIIKNKRQPTTYEVINACKEALNKNYVGNTDDGLFGGSVDISDAELALAGIKRVDTYSDPNTLHVVFADGRRMAMTAEELQNLVQVNG